MEKPRKTNLILLLSATLAAVATMGANTHASKPNASLTYTGGAGVLPVVTGTPVRVETTTGYRTNSGQVQEVLFDEGTTLIVGKASHVSVTRSPVGGGLAMVLHEGAIRLTAGTQRVQPVEVQLRNTTVAVKASSITVSRDESGATVQLHYGQPVTLEREGRTTQITKPGFGVVVSETRISAPRKPSSDEAAALADRVSTRDLNQQPLLAVVDPAFIADSDADVEGEDSTEQEATEDKDAGRVASGDRATPEQPGAESPDAENPEPSDPGSETPDPGTPDPGTPDPGNPDAGTPDPGTPDPGTPDPGSPDPGTPDPGPRSRYPRSGLSRSRYPRSGLSRSRYPRSGRPGFRRAGPASDIASGYTAAGRLACQRTVRPWNGRRCRESERGPAVTGKRGGVHIDTGTRARWPDAIARAYDESLLRGGGLHSKPRGWQRAGSYSGSNRLDGASLCDNRGVHRRPLAQRLRLRTRSR